MITKVGATIPCAATGEKYALEKAGKQEGGGAVKKVLTSRITNKFSVT